MNNSIICIPTYNRPEAINELLLRYKDKYFSLGFDVAIYDSSSDDRTKEIVAKYLNNDGVVYYRIDSKTHSNLKVINIYENLCKESLYSYVWVQSDSIRWNDCALTEIKNAVDSGIYDYIIPNYRDGEKIGNKVYTDKNDFFVDCAWHMTLYGAAVIRLSSFDKVNWDYIKSKYCIPDRINFSHVGLYFESIQQLNHFKALHISLPEYSLTSTLFKKDSGWRKETFFILCECWPNVIYALPDKYKEKDKVIKKITTYSGELTENGLKKLRIEGILNYKTFNKYKKKWKVVSDIPLCKLFIISVAPKRIVRLTENENRNTIKLLKKLRRFCKKYDEIYIYGCGQKGEAYASHLDALGIPYKGFLISKDQNDKKTLHGKCVKKISYELLNNKDCGILLAMNKLNIEQVKQSIMKIDIQAGIFEE